MYDNDIDQLNQFFQNFKKNTKVSSNENLINDIENSIDEKYLKGYNKKDEDDELFNSIKYIINEFVKQFVIYGIDYKNYSHEFSYNYSINDYIDVSNNNIKKSFDKRYESCKHLNSSIRNCKLKSISEKLIHYFIDETYANIKLLDDIDKITMENFKCILSYNLCMPLRAINSYIPETNLYKTEELNLKDIKTLTFNINKSVLHDTFSDFKFKSMDKQLSHLSKFNRYMWKYQYKCSHNDNLYTTEGDDKYYIYFWVSKIGDYLHSFDCNPQCLYTLLCNARNKVIILYHKFYDDFVCKAYLRILQTNSEAILWLEDIECNYNIYSRIEDKNSLDEWKQCIIDHAYKRSKQLGVKLVIPWIDDFPKEKFSIILDPSDGILETSKFISDQENWIQKNIENYDLFCHVYNKV
tara:strand:- start:6137 stop:7366 length:1230 start_codon:yes stop_codon:yes gene_type:complete